MAPPPRQVACHAAHQPAVEQQLRLALALLARVGNRPGSRRRPSPLEEGLEAVDVDRRAAAHLARQREGVGVGARAGGHREGAVPPRAQLTNVGGVDSEQLLGPQSPTLNAVPTRPKSSFAFRAAEGAAARTSRTSAPSPASAAHTAPATRPRCGRRAAARAGGEDVRRGQ